MKFLTSVIIQFFLCALSIELPLQSLLCLSSRAFTVSTEIYPPPAGGYTFGAVLFQTIYSSPLSHTLPFEGIQHPAVHLFKAHWPPAVLRVCMTAFLDINSSGSRQSPTGSETWDQFPGGSTTSSLVMHSSKHSCHCHGWEDGEGSSIAPSLVTFTVWL